MNFRICFLLFLVLTIWTNGISQTTSYDCKNFGRISTLNSGFLAGDLDVSGNQITVEALVNCSGLFPNSYNTHEQNIVSKHLNPQDVNYLLRLNHVEITTSAGFFTTDAICDLPFGKTYHLALVYDGSNLKFYRNGQLMAQRPCQGNMILNNWPTTIGAFAAQQFDPTVTLPQNATFNGYINEVRVWNVARTAQQLDSYKDKILPNPTTQTGLMAYYQFDNLKNKQGNTAYDLSLLGTPTINQTVPICTLGDEPCPKCSLTASFTSQMDVCNPLKFSFSNTTENVSTYSWSTGNEIFSTSANSERTFQLAGNYPITLTVSDGKGCSASKTESVVATALPDVITTQPTEICKNASLQLQSGVSDIGTQYIWSPAEGLSDPTIANPIATLDKSTEYHLHIKKSNGCEQEDSVEINVIDAAKFSISPMDTTICTGQSVVLRAIGGDQYQWKTTDGQLLGTSAELQTTVNNKSQYIVDIQSTKCNEKATLSTSTDVYPLPQILTRLSNQINCANLSTTLFVSGANEVQWSNSSDLVANGNQATVSPLTTTIYNFVAIDQYGCSYPETIMVPVTFDASKTKVDIPSAFTPNRDGRNDIFRVVSNIAFSTFELKVFNRYGEMVFITQNSKNGWNGEYKGRAQSSGTYIYEVTGVNNICGEFHKRGTLVLIR